MQAEPGTPGQEPGRPIRVLLVDDQEIVGAGLRRLLAAAGCPVDLVHLKSAAEAVETACRLDPEVILQDLVLPDANGQEVVSAYRTQVALRNTPIIVLSSIEEPTAKAEAFSRGANDYLVKLPAGAELAARIRYHAAAHRAGRERDQLVDQLRQAEVRLTDRNRQLDEFIRLLSIANDALATDVEERRGRLEAAHRLGEELLQIHDLDVLFDRIVGEADSVARLRGCALFVRDVPHDRYALEDGRTRTGGSLSRVLVDDGSTGLIGRAIAGERVARYEGGVGQAPLEPQVAKALGVEPKTALAFALSDPGLVSSLTLAVLVVVDPLTPESAPRGFTADEERQLQYIASLSTLAIERARLTRSMVLRMVRMAELRDPSETGAHVQRVAGYALVLFDEWAKRRKLPDDDRRRQRDRLQMAALLHDVGKVAISDAILQKPGKLDPAERRAMEQHTTIGGSLFGLFRTDFDEAARDVALNHHERWDGGGYPGQASPEGTPRGLAGESIPLFARIVAVADVYDALTSARPYKEPWSEERVRAYLAEEAGRHFDPDLVAIALEKLGEFKKVRERIEAKAHPG